MAKHNSNSRTVELLRKVGFFAQTAEMWVDRAGVRRDLLGWIDVMAIRKDQGIIGIQATISMDLSDHKRKMRENPALMEMLRAGGRGQLWRWNKVPKGTRLVWRPLVQEVRIQDDKIVFVPLADEEWIAKLGV